MSIDSVKIVHQFTGGYLEYDGERYPIEAIEAGTFAIHFPAGKTHGKLQEHLNMLTKYAKSREPIWYVENRSRKYK